MASKDLEPSEGGDNVTPIDDGEKGGKKKLLIILVPLILLIGGGAAAYFTGMLDKVLGKDATKTEEGTEGEASKEGEHGEKAEEGGEEAAEGEGGATGPAFLKIPDMVINLNSDTGEQRYLRLSIQLELKNAADQAAVEKVLPRVVDQFQTYLRELRLQDLRGSKGIYRLQMELLSRVNQAAAPIEVKDVLFQEILIQ
ncbi:MAG: flagellar basal body protein FliL [Micavibrio aeruginosavorus]|uniref:Flagellar protein FliL n=1 Tax=Micavibrio aeruginosavorus TaxID=349221 RepID=A0A2W5H6D8_9BACT|nr:MAG: flagellar basal body protein FliL [Micavibrio aeruginosavorus]